jgi:hypothetical protein
LSGSSGAIEAEMLREILRSEVGSISATDTLLASPPYTPHYRGGDQQDPPEALLDLYVTRCLEMLRERGRLVVVTSGVPRRKASRR